MTQEQRGDDRDGREPSEIALPAGTPEAVTRERIIAYAGASGDFNPMHVDEVTNTAAGMGGVFAHGMFGTGLLGRAATDYLGDVLLRSLAVRCTRIVRPGDVLHVEGTVSERPMTERGPELCFRLLAKNQHGDVTHVGTASALLPLTEMPGKGSDRPPSLVTWRAIG